MSSESQSPSQEPTAGTITQRHHREMLGLFIAGVIIVLVLLAVGILPRLKNNSALAASSKEAKTAVPEVVVVRPTWASDKGVDLPGNIEAIKEATLNARTTGFLRVLRVDIGSKVKAGQLLAEIQAPDTDQQLLQALAQTQQSRAVVAESQADVNRQRASVVQARADVQKQQATIEQAQAQLAGSQAAVSQAQASEQGAEAALEHSNQALNVQESGLKQQQATLALSEVTFKRYKDLVGQGFDSQQDLDQAQATLKTSESAVTSAEASIKEAQADVNSAQKAVQAAREAVSSAQANVVANQKNVSANVSALASLQATVHYNQESVRVSQATVNANQAGVNSNVANQLRYSVMKDFEKIIAPFDGVITSRSVDVGTLIVGDNAAAGSTGASTSAVASNSSTAVAGSGMLSIARTDVVRIQISVPQSFVPALEQGSQAMVTVREIAGRIFSGKISMRAGALDTVSRTQLVEVDLPNPDGALVPGMYANVHITPTHPPTTLRVPGTALIIDSNGTRVGVVDKTNTVHMVPVVIGRDFGTTVEILSGLRGHERLVNNPTDLLQDNDKVTIATSTAKNKGTAGIKTGRPVDTDDSDSMPPPTLGGKSHHKRGGASGGAAEAPGASGAAEDTGKPGSPEAANAMGTRSPDVTGAEPAAGHHHGTPAAESDTAVSPGSAETVPASGQGAGADGMPHHHHHKSQDDSSGAGGDSTASKP